MRKKELIFHKEVFLIKSVICWQDMSVKKQNALELGVLYIKKPEPSCKSSGCKCFC
jgi:hypothetical protein